MRGFKLSDTRVENPEIISPNVSVAIAPNGYIRVVFGYDLISSAFYMDGTAARLVGEHFMNAAEEFDRVWAEFRAGEADEGDDKVIPMAPFMAQKDTSEVLDADLEESDEGADMAMEHERAVEDAIELEARPNDFD